MYYRVYGAVMIVSGVYCCLMAWGFVPRNPDPERMELWHKKFGKPVKLLSPVMVVVGFLYLFGVLD